MPTEYILSEDQEKWLTALESGEYKQCRSRLSDGAGFCCLGVGCVVLGMKESEIAGAKGLLHSKKTRDILSRLRLRSSCGAGIKGNSALDRLNDWERLTLKQIAAVIRKDPSVYFHE